MSNPLDIKLGERRTLADVHREMHALHAEYAPVIGCEGSHSWQDCEGFALARVRALCHTLFVVQRPDFDFQIVDWGAEGPVEALYAQVSNVVEFYSDALEYATSIAATEDRNERDETPLAELIAKDALDYPHDDPCPRCGRRQWTDEQSQETCQACGFTTDPDVLADRVMQAIHAEMHAPTPSGLDPIPADKIKSLVDVHDYRDANVYFMRTLAGIFPRGDENAEVMFSDDETDLTNTVAEIVDRRLRAEATRCAVCQRPTRKSASGEFRHADDDTPACELPL